MSESSIHFRCPTCGSRLRARSKHIGKVSVCPCGARCKVPDHHGSTKSVVVTVQNPGVVEFDVQPQGKEQITLLGIIVMCVAILLVTATLIWASWR